jgi:hypothetical protein
VLVAMALPNIITNPIIAILLLFMALSWLNKYAFALLDHAANGRSEAPVASLEMLGPFHDLRVWVHPVLALLLAGIAWRVGARGAPIVLGVGAFLMPASIAAIAMSGRSTDALNPAAIWNALRGLGPFYLLVLAGGGAVALAVWALMRGSLPVVVTAALTAFVFLEWYALIGASIHERRFDLGFDPVVDPEAKALKAETGRQRDRQKALDEAYGAIRAREPARAAGALDAWLAAGAPAQRAVDVDFFIAQAAAWPEQKGLATVLRAVIAHALRTRQAALALIALEAGLAKLPAFSVETAEDAEALAVAARHSGRRRLAATVLDNFAATRPGATLPENLQAVRAELPR